MRCRKIRKLLDPYLDGECSSAECQKVDKHLQRCPACRAELEILQKTYSLTRALDQGEPDESYWKSFLPRLRTKIDEQHRQPLPGRIRQAIRQFFKPPVPWVRLSGTLAAAVLVFMVGRALIRHESHMGQVRSLPRRLLTEQAIQSEGGQKAVLSPLETEQQADATKEKMVPAEEISAPAKGPTIPRADELAHSSEALPDGEKSLRPKKETNITPLPPPAPTSTDRGIPFSENDAKEVSASKAARGTDFTSDAVISQEKGVLGTTRTSARTLGPDHWRESIEYWQEIVDSGPDENVLQEAYFRLAQSRYQLALTTAGKEDLMAAVEAQRTALDFAAEDSTRQVLRERIQTLEDHLQKK